MSHSAPDSILDFQAKTLDERGTTRAEDAQGTPTQSHVSPSILVYEDKHGGSVDALLEQAGAFFDKDKNVSLLFFFINLQLPKQ